MRIFKGAMFVAAILLATQGHSFDLTHMAIRAVTSSLSLPKTQYDKHNNQKHRSGESTDVALPASTGNFGSCRQNFANGESPVSQGAKQTRALCFDDFAVLYSGETKTALFSAEMLNRERLQGAKEQSRTDVFFEDARVPSSERATLDDYRSSTFDRGHSSPAGDRHNELAMAQSFSLSNMVPQAPENNRKAWAGIEKATRNYAMRAQGNVYVITGAVYDSKQCPFVLAAQQAMESKGLLYSAAPEMTVREASTPGNMTGFKKPYKFDAHRCTIGNGVSVPSHLYKLVYDPTTNRAWAHWLQNTDWAQVTKPIAYSELVRRTGIEFLPGISPKS